MKDIHYVRVGKVDGKFQPQCTCGWRGKLWMTGPSAEREGQRHVHAKHPENYTGRKPAMSEDCGCSGHKRSKVEYADPGYQPDGKPRYRLDGEIHVRAAWGYINRPEYARKYTRQQLRLIHERIQRAGRRFGIQYGHARAKSATMGRTASRAKRRAGMR